MTLYFKAAGKEIEDNVLNGVLTMREKPLAYEYKDKIPEILQKVQSISANSLCAVCLCHINLQ